MFFFLSKNAHKFPINCFHKNWISLHFCVCVWAVGVFRIPGSLYRNALKT